MAYVYKNPYVKNRERHEPAIVEKVEKPKLTTPYVYPNPYTLKNAVHTMAQDSHAEEIVVPVKEEEIANASEHHEQDAMVSTVLPELLVEQIDALDLSRIMRDKALKLVSILYLKGMYNDHDLSKYVTLAAHYLEKTFNKEYHKDFFNRLKAAGIIQCNEEYQQGSMFKKGKAKGYRINGGLLNDAYVPVFYEDRKQKKSGKDGGLRKAEIFINRTYFYKDTNILPDNPINNSCSSNDTNQISSNTCLSIHISSRLFQKSLIIDDLSSLKYDQDRIWKATKERIAYISSRLFVDDEILRNSFEVTNCLLDNFTYHTTKEKAMKWAKEHDANVIQDGRHFYIQKLKQYVKAKKLNVYRNYKWQMARLKDKIFYAKRNDTNWRVDHNLTCAGKNIMEVIKEDNDLIEIDIKNSQFAIHAYWLKDAGLCKHEDVQRYYDMCRNGILYDEIGKSLGIERDAAKQLMFEMVFSDRRSPTASKKQFKQRFANVYEHIDSFKKEKKNSSLFSVELQQLESALVIDNLYPNIKELGVFCLTKHDSLIVKKQDEDAVVKVINAYFSHMEFECVLNIGDKEVSVTCS